MNKQDAEDLRKRSRFSCVVYDELETDQFVRVIRENLYHFLVRQQGKHPDWRNTPRHERSSYFASLLRENAIPVQRISFEGFDSLMRLKLSALKPMTVDFDAIPFGYDNKKGGLYNQRHGNIIYVGTERWMADKDTTWGFLTTETLMEKVVSNIHGLIDRTILSFTVPNIPGINPIKVPVVLDSRAGADHAGKPKITSLAQEILSANLNAVVIANGVNTPDDRVLTFQGAKGYNGLQDHDIYIIVTNLAPEAYEQLNVIGQFLDIPNIIDLHYRDQIAQAVGRNRGFRQSSTHATRTVIVTAKRLFDRLSRLHDDGGARVHLFEAESKQW